MTDFAVRYCFFDRDSGHTGEGNALVRLDGSDATGRQDLGCDHPEQRQWIEGYIAVAIANEFPQHIPERLVVLITRLVVATSPSCTAAEENL